ncbi:MAG: hypothetical protein HQM04_09955 [Magnetococcales bacterium]|nr:hypothetical protein [Magnetococcales bacterium]MBF0115356.1 hypothetical protein [Magnetococcales bacterium]
MNLRNTSAPSGRDGQRQGGVQRRFAARSQQPAAVRVRRSGSEESANNPALRRRVTRILVLLLLVGLLIFALRMLAVSLPAIPAIPTSSQWSGVKWPSWTWPDFSVSQWFAGSSFFAPPAAQEGGEVVVTEKNSCSVTSGNRSGAPFAMLRIPAGRYELPAANSPLHPFLNPQRLGEVSLSAPILIQEQPVSSTLFKQYVEAVEGMPDGEEKEEKRSHIGMFWNKKESVSPAVRGISLEAALDFNRWLSQKTGCDFQIPSREEWAATVIHLFHSGVSLPKPSDGFDATPLKSLLQGGSEWTRSPCPMGFYLVGEEDWGATIRDGHPSCMPNLFSVAGFRTVLHPAQSDEPVAAAEGKGNR